VVGKNVGDVGGVTCVVVIGATVMTVATIVVTPLGSVTVTAGSVVTPPGIVIVFPLPATVTVVVEEQPAATNATTSNAAISTNETFFIQSSLFCGWEPSARGGRLRYVERMLD
jgi:hypothetical protein